MTSYPGSPGPRSPSPSGARTPSRFGYSPSTSFGNSNALTASDKVQINELRKARDTANPLVSLVSRYQLHGIDNVKHSVSKVDNFLYHSQLELRQFAAECYVIATQLEAQMAVMRNDVSLIMAQSNASTIISMSPKTSLVSIKTNSGHTMERGSSQSSGHGMGYPLKATTTLEGAGEGAHKRPSISLDPTALGGASGGGGNTAAALTGESTSSPKLMGNNLLGSNCILPNVSLGNIQQSGAWSGQFSTGASPSMTPNMTPNMSPSTPALGNGANNSSSTQQSPVVGNVNSASGVLTLDLMASQPGAGKQPPSSEQQSNNKRNSSDDDAAQVLSPMSALNDTVEPSPGDPETRNNSDDCSSPNSALEGTVRYSKSAIGKEEEVTQQSVATDSEKPLPGQTSTSLQDASGASTNSVPDVSTLIMVDAASNSQRPAGLAPGHTPSEGPRGAPPAVGSTVVTTTTTTTTKLNILSPSPPAGRASGHHPFSSNLDADNDRRSSGDSGGRLSRASSSGGGFGVKAGPGRVGHHSPALSKVNSFAQGQGDLSRMASSRGMTPGGDGVSKSARIIESLVLDLHELHGLGDVAEDKLHAKLEEKEKKTLVQLAKDLLLSCREAASLSSQPQQIQPHLPSFGSRSNMTMSRTHTTGPSMDPYALTLIRRSLTQDDNERNNSGQNRDSSSNAIGGGHVIMSMRKRPGAGGKSNATVAATTVSSQQRMMNSVNSGSGAAGLLSGSGSLRSPLKSPGEIRSPLLGLTLATTITTTGTGGESLSHSGSLNKKTNDTATTTEALTPTRTTPAPRDDKESVGPGDLRESSSDVKLVASMDENSMPHAIQTGHVEEGEDAAGFQTLNYYTIVGEAGRGSYGTVMFAQTESGEERAIKMIPKQTMKKDYAAALRANTDESFDATPDLNEDGRPKKSPPPAACPQVTAANREIEVMMKIRHPNVLPLLEVMDDPEQDLVYLVMPYIERGPLLKVSSVGTCTPLDFDVVKGYTRQLVNAVQYLHERHIIHRDIKPENVLLGNDGRVYLSDFGVSKMFNKGQVEEVEETEGTPSFLAPETYPEFQARSSASPTSSSEVTDGGGRFSHLRCGPVEGKPLDVWALGVTVYLMLFGHLPFEGSNLPELKKHVLNDSLEFPTYSVVALRQSGMSTSPGSNGLSPESSPPLTPSTSEESGQESEKSPMDPEEELLRDLLKQMLVKDPRERASIRECCFHPAICRDQRANLDWMKRKERRGTRGHSSKGVTPAKNPSPPTDEVATKGN